MSDERDRVVAAAAEAVRMLLWVGEESYSADYVDGNGDYRLLSPIAGQDIDFQLISSMVVGHGSLIGSMHVNLHLTSGPHEVQAYCRVDCGHYGPYKIHVEAYLDGESAVRRMVSVERDGSMRPEHMPAELRLTDPGFEPVVCSDCREPVMWTVRRGRYFTCELAGGVTNPRAATMFYGWREIPSLTAGHLEDGRHAITH